MKDPFAQVDKKLDEVVGKRFDEAGSGAALLLFDQIKQLLDLAMILLEDPGDVAHC